MVKPDVKVNYYAALELGSDASIDDIKKQYRKLALKYHPDRNPGKEEEYSARFQAISAANEVLSDPTTKTKYDADRRRANLSGGSAPAAAPRPAASGQRGNPYAATSNFAPPPRRTADPTGWTRAQRPTPTSNNSGTGADRFANFPGPGPTSRQQDTGKASASTAWSFVGGQGQKKAGTAYGATSPQQTRRPPPVPPREHPQPPPPPPRQDPKREEEIRAGMNYRPAPAHFATPAERTAYAHFNAANANAQRPGVHRSATTSTPRRQGFDPNAPGSDERPTAGPTGYTNLHENLSARQQFARDQASQASSRSNGSTASRRSSGDIRPAFTEANRTSSSYAHAYTRSGGEKTYFSSDQLKRSQSTRDATKLSQQRPARPRSASPTKNKHTNGSSKTAAFGIPSDSESSSSDSELSSDAAKETGQFGNRPRPKKVPTSRLNGTRSRTGPGQPTYQAPQPGIFPNSSRRNSASTPASATTEQPPPPNMYDFPFPEHDSDWFHHHPFGPCISNPYERYSRVPPWAVPPSVRFHTTGKQKEFQDGFQQDPLGYIPDPPLVDLDEPINPAFRSTPSLRKPASSYFADMHLLQPDRGDCHFGSDPQYERDCEGVSIRPFADKEFYSFTMPTTFDNQNQTTGRATEDINTSFSPGANTPIFTGSPVTNPVNTGRRPSPAKRTSTRQSTKSSTSQSSYDQRYTSTNVTPTATQGPSSSEHNFAPERWADISFGPGQARRSSQSGNVQETATPEPATVYDTSDTEEGGLKAQATTPLADAMDIDPAPPAESKQARPYAVPPSTWRMAQTSSPQTTQHGRRSSARSIPEVANQDGQRASTGGTIPSLQPLSATLNEPNGTGLSDMSNITNSMPFTSKPSSTHPNKMMTPDIPTTLPKAPMGPTPPQKITKLTWRDHTARMSAYLSAWHAFQSQLSERTRETRLIEERLLVKGPAGLEAQGEASTDVGVETYARRCKEDRFWIELASAAQERHVETLIGYGRLKERVRELAERGMLGDQ